MNPTREALADVRAYQARRATMTVETTSFLIDLSGVSTGLEQIERGKVDSGAKVARHGLEFLRGLMAEGNQ